MCLSMSRHVFARRSLMPLVMLMMQSDEWQDHVTQRIVKWRLSVFDEAHEMRNMVRCLSVLGFRSYTMNFLGASDLILCIAEQEGRAIAALTVKSRMKVLVTGTPVSNRMRDLWTLLYVLYPDLFISHRPFER